MFRSRTSLSAVALACILLSAASALGRQVPQWRETVWPVNKSIGPLVNKADTRAILDTRFESVPVSSIIRLKFASWTLPRGTAIRITSLRSLEAVEMDAPAMQAWGGFSPMFNDDSLFVELVADPGAPPASFTLGSANGIRTDPMPPRGVIDDICGNDDRIRSNHTSVARFWVSGGLCTASLIASGDAAVSAGHCGLPVAGDFIEFDPPDSVINPTTGTFQAVLAHVSNRFPVNTSRIQRNFTFTLGPCSPPNQTEVCILSYGQDALAFGLNTNTTGQTAGHRRGDYLRIARLPGVQLNYIGTQWGCGTAAGATHMALKFVTGAVSGIRLNRDGGDFWEYITDTTPGDSGGPLIHPVFNASLGVVSSGLHFGCASSVYAFSNPAFQNAVETVVNQGTTRFVDSRGPAVPGETVGSIWCPSQTFRANAYDVVATQGTVLVAPGTYAAGTVLSRRATIRAPFGPITLVP